MVSAVRPFWRKHLWVVAIAAASCLPVWLLDASLLDPAGGGWITLDLRGYLLGAWVLTMLIFVAITSLAVQLRQRFQLGVYFLVLFVILLIYAAGFAVWRSGDQSDVAEFEAQTQASATQLADGLSLDAWWVDENDLKLVLLLSEPLQVLEVVATGQGVDGSVAAEGRSALSSLDAGATRISVPLSRYRDEAELNWFIELRLEGGLTFANIEFSDDPQPGEGVLSSRQLPPQRNQIAESSP